jgi:hypothetical protein
MTEAVRQSRQNRLLLVFDRLDPGERASAYLQLQLCFPVKLPDPPEDFSYLAFDEKWRPYFSKNLEDVALLSW